MCIIEMLNVLARALEEGDGGDGHSQLKKKNVHHPIERSRYQC